MKTATLLERKRQARKPMPLEALRAGEPAGTDSALDHSANAASGESALKAPDGWQPATLAQVRAVHIERMLEFCGGNRVRAAGMLGIGRTSLYRFLKRQSRRKGVGNGE